MKSKRTRVSIGLDFDNTIVCYDSAITELGVSELKLGPDVCTDKTTIRNYLRSLGREQDWVRFQGLIYGPGMSRARPFNGCIETLMSLQQKGADLQIISHRSRYPYAGPKYDLHDFANNWIEQNLKPFGLFVDPVKSPVCFNETKDQKLEAIAKSACDFFVDDLLDIVASLKMGHSVTPILFSPGRYIDTPGVEIICSWSELDSHVFNGELELS